MRFRRCLLVLLALAAVLPGRAAAEGVRVVARDEPMAAVRSAAVRAAPAPFTLVGIHWRGSGAVWFRTAADGEDFGPWRPAGPEAEDLPDLGSPELQRAAGWKVGNPWWTGKANRIQYRISGTVTRLRTFFVSSPVSGVDEARVARAAPVSLSDAGFRPARPAIVRRSGWGADESIVRAAPYYADRLRFAVVHHTAGTNRYSAAQAAAIVRGIQRYHVLGNGWNDIGYNFLVDKYGRIYEGRAGGLTRNVVGAHAQGFNTGSAGVAVLGSFDSRGISRAAKRALHRLLAWRLDVGHVDPLSHLSFASYGNERYGAGTVVRLRAISGHRDTGYTSCPGRVLYGRLGAIAQTVAGIGLPKLYDPRVTGLVGGPVRFRGRLSAARPWLVQVKDAAGAVVASGRGTGTAVDWTWNATTAPIQPYTYVISSGSDVRPATGAVPSPPPLAISGLRAAPAVLSPNGDWKGERTRISFGLTRRAAVAVRVESAATGALVRSLLPREVHPAGLLTVSWGGRAQGAVVPDARYRVEVEAEAGIERVVRRVPLKVDRTLGGLVVVPAILSPNGDGRLESLSAAFTLTRAADTRVEIRREGRTVRSLVSERLLAGRHTVSWDGRTARGRPLADGDYRARVLARTWLGTRTLSLPVRVDGTAPRVIIRSLRVAGGVASVRFTLSETARLRIRFWRSSWRDGVSIVRRRGAGTHVVRHRIRARHVRIVAVDAALNRAKPVFFHRR
jgi:flagellar hook assembly protein FlgD